MIERNTYRSNSRDLNSTYDSSFSTTTNSPVQAPHATVIGQTEMDSNGALEEYLESGTRSSEVQIGGDHYKDMPIQPSEFIHRNGLNWLEGNAIKYICRHSRKHGVLDIDKAIHYLNLLKEWEYKGHGSTP